MAKRKRKLPPGLLKRGNTYHVDFFRDGRRICEALQTRDERAALERYYKLRGDAVSDRLKIKSQHCQYRELRDKFLKWAKQHKKPRTFEQYERDFKAFEAFATVTSTSQITDDHVMDYRDYLRSEGDCPRTINRKVGVIQNMLNRAARKRDHPSGGFNMIESNPISGVKPLPHTDPRKERRALDPSEVEALLEECPANLLPLFRLMLSTGLRRDELIGLQFDDIDWSGQAITVKAKAAKSRKERTIPVDDETMMMLVEAREAATSREPHPSAPGRFSRDHVFVTEWNTPHRNNLLRKFKAICRRAGIQGTEAWGDVDLHSLRATFVTAALDAGANAKAVQEIVGHAHIETTMAVYNKTTDRQRRAAVAALPWAKVSPPDGVVEFPGPSTTKNSRSHADKERNNPKKTG